MELTSNAFTGDENIPAKYTGEGQDLSPPLEWSGVPTGCREFVLICEDQTFVHWLIYNISPTTTALPEGLPARDRIDAPVRAEQGENSFGKIGYGGPMPPPDSGTHHYVFTLYALNTDLAVPPGAGKAELLKAMQGHIIDSTRLVGTYERRPAAKVA